MELKERCPESVSPEYLKNWSSFAWLLYIQVKNKAFHKSFDLIENTCMLSHTLAFMLTFAWDYLLPKALIKLDKRINEQSSRIGCRLDLEGQSHGDVFHKDDGYLQLNRWKVGELFRE
jgi:hypothetical protein